MASSSATSRPSKPSYGVFLSFRGSDTRQSFASHLYDALRRKHIRSFIDDKDLDRGKEISTLLETIRGSKISVIVFSQEYASSRWCLDELVTILECTETTGHTAIPIFYKVHPSDVGDLTGNFGKAFKRLTKRFCSNENRVKTGLSALKINRVKKWCSALKKAANLSGWDSSNYRNEVELVVDIVEDIFQRLYPNPFTTSNELVATDSHIKKILPCLSMGSEDDVRFVGLWGMGGIGKTTIAEILYSQMSCQFDRCYFFRSVMEEAHKHGLTHLRNKFLCHLLGMQNLNIEMLHAVPTYIRDSLGRLKVFVVLDDVSDKKQLEAFGIGEGWFGPGSRIILTSRDKQVLNSVDDIYIYKVPGLDKRNAFELLSMKAFKQKYPPKDYMELSKRVLHYAQGLPLALTVLGSHLHNRPPQEWELELNKLNQFPDPGIQEILEISFEGLDDALKLIFLDICCLEGHGKGRIIDILDGCGFPTEWGINRLREKCLISSDECDRLQLHDLVKEMGQEIARRIGRLYNNKDIIHISTINARNETVEAIVLNMAEVGKKHFDFEVLSLMPRLQLLDINGDPQVNYESYSPPCLSSNLRLLHWANYTFKSLPSIFSMENLVELRMPNSKAIHLWDGNQCLPYLKILDLCGSVYLTRLPDLFSATEMKEIYLSGCTSLVVLPPWIGTLKNLVTLDVSGCRNLRSIPSLILASSLYHFYLTGCSSLKILPKIPSTIGYIDCSKSGVEKWIQNEALPDPLDFNEEDEIPCITRCLTITNSSKFERIRVFSSKPGALYMIECENLAVLPESIHEFKCLELLVLDGCSKLSKLPPLNGLDSLRVISVEDSGIAEIPTDIVSLPSLATLRINKCKRLQSLPLLLPRKLVTLEAKDCTILQAASARYLSYQCDNSLSYWSYQFDFRNCIKLDNNARRKIMSDVCWRVEQELAIIPTGVIRFNIVLPGTEIPEWFENQSEEDSMVVKLPHVAEPSYHSLACCAVVEFDSDAAEKPIGFCCDFISSASTWPFCSSDYYYSWDLNESAHVFFWYIIRPLFEDVFIGKEVSFRFKPAYNSMEKVRIRRWGIKWIVRKHR